MPDLSPESIMKLRLLHQKLPDMPEKMRAEAEKVIIGAFETLADMAERLLNLEGRIIEFVSPQACEKHQEHILALSFGDFCEELEGIGCKWCLYEKNKRARALADAVAEEIQCGKAHNDFWCSQKAKRYTPEGHEVNAKLIKACRKAEAKKSRALDAYLEYVNAKEAQEESALSADLSSLPLETENPVGIDRIEASPADTAFLETSKNVRREICQATIIPPKECNANEHKSI